jgi:transitional endoplasmic reticulum ATPase
MRLKNIMIVCIFMQLIVILISSVNTLSMWQGTEFDSNLILNFEPVVPNNLDPVNVTISSINSSQQISSAYIYCNFTRDGVFTEGGYTFKFGNPAKTEMYCLIPGYQNIGGTIVNFYVIAYDEINAPITSDVCSYTVTRNGSWLYSTFLDNILVSFEPKNPDPYQEVEVTIQSRLSNIPIVSAEISWEIDTPGQSLRNGMASFNSLSQTIMNATIPGYEGDSNVTFSITAYDQYYSSLTSPSYHYSVGPSDMTYIYDMVIEVVDDYLKIPAEGASVTISNETGIVYTGLTTSQGLLMAPVIFHTGEYTVEVEYNSKTQTKEITIPYEDNNQITFHFEAQAVVVKEFVTFPHFYDYVGIIGALFIPLIFCWIFYKKQHERLLALTEKKKTFGRKNEEEKKGIKTMLGDLLAKETKQPKLLIPMAFFMLGVFGAVFIPFYPWWAILIVASFIGVVAYKFPFSALLLVSIFVTGSAAYQKPEFGLIFLIFSLIIMLCSFYDWKFGYLVFLMIFISRFGVAFIIPVFAVMVFSTFLAIAVTLCAGVFLVLLVSASDYQVIGLIAGANHSTAFMIFSKPVVENFTPGTYANVMGDIAVANPDIIGSVLAEGFATSMLPFFMLAAWCFGIFLLSYLIDEKKRLSFTKLKEWMAYPYGSRKFTEIMLCSMFAIVLSSLGTIYWFGYIESSGMLGLILLSLLFIGAAAVIYTTVVSCLIVREMFREYFTSRIGVSTVGARVSEMADLGKTTFEQVGGLEDVKLDIKESILVPLLRPDIADQFGVEPAKGILLFGAPGCGKTLTMKALATELNIEMFTVKCGDLMSKWYGESETRMMTLFKTAKERKPAIIFFDEIDAVAKRRDLYSADDVTPRLLSIMLSELDGMDRATGIIIVGSTNKPELVDPALLRPGRFDKIIYVPPPDFNERIDILKVHMAGKPLKGDIDLKELAKRTEGFSGADLANLVKEGATNAMRRSMKTKQITTITQKDFLDILPRIKPSISLTMKEEYERIKMRYERKMHDLSRGEKGSTVTLDLVAGLGDVKRQLMDFVIMPLTKRKLIEKFKLKTGRAILLHSPPGCGKTYLMKAIANQHSIPFQEVTGSELLYAINTEGTLAIKGLWSMLRDMAPAILFISDIDSIASKETIKEEEGKKAFSVFLSMLDNIQPNDMVVIVATSENPDALDPSLFVRGRMDKHIFVPPPDIGIRKRIFELNLADVPKIGDIDYDVLAKATDGFSGEDIFAVVEEAKLLALSKEDIFSRSLKGKKKPLGVKMPHLMNAVQKVNPSIRDWEERIKISKAETDVQALVIPAVAPPKPPEKALEKIPPASTTTFNANRRGHRNYDHITIGE